MSTLVRTLSLARRGIKNYFSKGVYCVSFEITHSCNARCKHCHLGGPVQEQRATPQRYGELCRELKPVVAQLSGGEPMLRNDLEEIVKALRIPNRAPYIVITTNATLLTKEKYLRLRRAGVDEFSISLDYPDERHDEFRGVPGLFNRIERLIKEIEREKNKAITLCCVIQKDNYKELLRMAELASEWNVKINFSAYTLLRTKDKNYMLSREDLGEFKEITEHLIDFKKKYKNIYTSDYILRKMVEFFEKGYISRCRTGDRFCNVNPDGTFSPCGLIITNYKSRKELNEKFVKNNTCVYCYTAIRGNGEKPTWYLVKDSLKALFN